MVWMELAKTSLNWQEIYNSISDHEDLSLEKSYQIMSDILLGKISDIKLSALLLALKTKGESVSEISGFSKAMLEAAIRFETDLDPIDIVGTGGSKQSQKSSLNTSTMSSFLVASVGVPVCKHGNNRVSSTSGSFDFLKALGIPMDLDDRQLKSMLDKFGLTFLYARNFHPGMKYVSNVRKELGVRTVFNILGPLANPSNVKRVLLGTPDKNLSAKLAQTLLDRGFVHAWVVTGSDGLDELTLAGSTDVYEVKNSQISHFQISPQDYGFSLVSEIDGGNEEDNLSIFFKILNNEESPQKDLVVYNSAAALVVSDHVKSISDGIEVIHDALDSGLSANFVNEIIGFLHS